MTTYEGEPQLQGLQEPYSVSELNREARYLLEDSFPAILVEGEVSNVAMPASGHWYLTLKDERSQLRCAMFRNRNLFVRFRPAEGMQVLAKGRLSIYEGRGDYQLIVETLEERGDGALRRAFEELKEKLFAEGLFDANHKRDVPVHPRHIGVITSPSGAAIRDVLSVLKRRFPAIPVTILPVSVQGRNAAAEMIRAIETANLRRGCLADLEVLLLTRGGGSLEDLWSFNDEGLARAIHASDLPVVSAVGHEIDFTIADFVADLRAPTPSAAAELISPNQEAYFQHLAACRQKLRALMEDRIRQDRRRLDWLTRQLRHPGRRLQEQAQRLDELEARLTRAFHHNLYRARTTLEALHSGLMLHSPATRVRQYKQENRNLRLRLAKAVKEVLRHKRQALAEQTHALNTVSPLGTLSRGYSITFTGDGTVIRHPTQIRPGDSIETRLHGGRISSTVDAVKNEGDT